MQSVAITLLVITSIALIALVVMQSGKSEGLSGAISGGAEQLFGKKKARGIDAVLNRATIIVSVLFFILTFLLAYVL
ncbi:preprotein translocase subunit SecG [Amphibacillus sp. Q70]|uniref:preprotein translocase subunit SecG n=1 Tax=Amphibacillus sp. Q70 TaxID=3453416 RepID=UPI003F82F715